MPTSAGAIEKLSVAYEPVWAIGTGRVPSNADIEAMHRAIRAKLVAVYGAEGAEVRILYGGSVKAENAADILAVPEVGGALVGGEGWGSCCFDGGGAQGLSLRAAPQPSDDR